MKTLICTFKYWDMIVLGDKKAEYRKYTPKWDKWLANFRHDAIHDYIIIRRGYTSTYCLVEVVQIFREPNIQCPELLKTEWGWDNSLYDMVLAIDVIQLSIKGSSIRPSVFKLLCAGETDGKKLIAADIHDCMRDTRIVALAQAHARMAVAIGAYHTGDAETLEKISDEIKQEAQDRGIQ